MLHKRDTMRLFEAHGTLCTQILDTDMVEPFSLGEKPAETAAKLNERAQHLATILGAAVAYAKVIAGDIEESTWSIPGIRHALGRLDDDAKDLCGAIERLAQASEFTAVRKR